MILFKKEFKCRCGLNKSTESLGSIKKVSEGDEPDIKDRTKNIQSWGSHDDSSYSKVNHLFVIKDIRNFISDDIFLVKDSNGDNFFIYFDIENQIFEIDNNQIVPESEIF